MNSMDLQRIMPAHVAVPLRLAYETRLDRDSTACLLYTGHRLLRWVLACRDGWSAETVLHSRFGDLGNALLKKGKSGSQGPLEAATKKAVKGKETKKAVNDLLAAAELFLAPEMFGGGDGMDELARECRSIVAGLTTSFQSLFEAWLATCDPELPDTIFLWSGPGGHDTTATEHGLKSRATAIIPASGESPVEVGPATVDTPPRPLLPLAGPDGGGWWECPQGRVYGKDGRVVAPLGRLTPAATLGRLLFWHLGPDENPAHVADQLADSGMPEAGGELLTAAVASKTDDCSPEAFEQAVHFHEENDLEQQGTAFQSFFLEKMEEGEATLREADDLKGVSDILLKRQQLETGSRKTLTLSRLANLFREKLDDQDAGFVCLLSAVDEDPEDPAILGDLQETARQLGKEQEAAERLLELVEEQKGPVREALARIAGDLYLAGNPNPSQAARAYKAALESAHEDHDLLKTASDVAVQLADHVWLEELLKGRIKVAPDNEARMEAILALAVVLQDQGKRPAEAMEQYRQALVIDPNHKESFEALLDLQLGAGKPEDARNECEGLLSRTFDPTMRAAVLRRYASLLIEVFKDDGAAANALSEAFILNPEDRNALELLGTLYEGLGQWSRLIGFLRRRASDEPDNAVQHLLKMAEISKRNLEDPDAALGFLTEAAQLAPEDPEPGRLIQALHEELGLWAEVARDLEAKAEQAQSQDKTEIWTRLGELYLERLSLRGRAKESFWKALESAPLNSAADLAQRLVTLHREDGENAREFEALNKAVKALGEDEKAADIHSEMGRLALEEPVDRKAARTSLETAVSLNPVHPDAVERLASLLLEDNEPERVISLVEPLAGQAAERKDTETERKHRLLIAGAAMKCSDLEAAMAQYTRVVELDPADHRSRVVLGWLLSQAERDEEAITLLTRVLDEAGDDLTTMDRIEVLDTIAACSSRQGDHTRALEMQDAAYRLKGSADAQTLRNLAAMASETGAGDKIVAYLEELVAIESKGPQRFADKVQLGDVLRETREDPAGAMRWYLEAADEGVSPKAALHKALDAALVAGENDQARTILERILEEEVDGVKQAQFHYALALHIMEHIKDSATARKHLWMSLELQADQEDAVKALENLLTAENDEEGLARLYQLLARNFRLTGQDEKLQASLRRLATIYEERLKNPVLAAQAYQQLLKTAPLDVDASIRMAEVLTRAPGKESEALHAHRKVLKLDPTHEGSYRAIRDLCVVMGDEDGAWTAAAALKVLGHATEADVAAFEAGRQPALMLKRDRLPEGAFEKLISDKDAQPGMARVLSILYEPLRGILPWKQPKDLGLSDGDRIDMRQKGMLQNMAAAASQVLGIPLPAVYRVQGRNGLAKLAFNPPALAAGDDVVHGWRGKELRFGLGRALATFAPGFQLAGISEVETLRLFFLAALRIAFPDYPIPDDATGVDEMAKDLGKTLSQEMKTEINAILTVFRRDQKAIDSQAFLRGLDLTASRAGLFLANDLYVAGGLLSEDTLFLSDLEYGDRVTDLCAWTVSTQYAELRRKMLRSAEGK